MKIKNTNIYPLKKAVKGDYVVGTDSENFGRTVNFEVEQFLGENSGGVSEGVDILSTGETGGFRFLGENGDGTSSWKTLTGGGDAQTSGTLAQFAATTLAELNSIMQTALIDTNDSRLDNARAPLSHTHIVSEVIGAGDAQTSGTLAQFAATTLSELNAVLSDATLITTSDNRLSDARPPLSHTHDTSEINELDVLVKGKTTDDIGTTIPLDSAIGRQANMETANSNTNYTLGPAVTGAITRVFINSITISVAGAEIEGGIPFEPNTDMYMVVFNKGTDLVPDVVYWFYLKDTVASGGASTLQEVITAGNTYAPDAFQTWTWDEDKLTYLHTGEDFGFELDGENLQFTSGSGSAIGKSGFSVESCKIGNGTNSVNIISSNITADRILQSPDKDGTIATTDDVTINSEPIGNEVQVLQIVEISQVNYNLITPVATTFYIING